MQYHENAADALLRVAKGFLKYIEAPTDFARLERADGTQDRGAHGAVAYKADGWWAVKATIIQQHTHASFTFMLKNVLDHFEVKGG